MLQVWEQRGRKQKCNRLQGLQNATVLSYIIFKYGKYANDVTLLWWEVPQWRMGQGFPLSSL
jgi:hypothetical protein